MGMTLQLEFDFDDDEWEAFLKQAEIEEDPSCIKDWANGELCQNKGMGFITGCRVFVTEDES